MFLYPTSNNPSVTCTSNNPGVTCLKLPMETRPSDVYIKHRLNAEDRQRKDYHLKQEPLPVFSYPREDSLTFVNPVKEAL